MKTYKKSLYALIAVAMFAFIGCQNQDTPLSDGDTTAVSSVMQTRTDSDTIFYQGADLSYVNELEDGGVSYYEDNNEGDPYQMIKSYGANLVRLRLWHNPTWTNYSNLADVKRSIARAKSKNMYVLLDFHYSDTWTDPQQNLVPQAWLSVVNNTAILADSIYNYTFNTLLHLYNNNLLPDLVQIGNETNNNIMIANNDNIIPTNFSRNTILFNAGISAVNAFNNTYSTSIKKMLHIAMVPNDAISWLNNHLAQGLLSFDMLGVSYYPQWQLYTPQALGEFAASIYNNYGIQLFVAETGHIWTRAWNDNNHNLMSNMSVGYPETPCPQLQKDYLIEVKEALMNNHGAGFCVWEPFWVSADNQTLWGVGSNWENVTFFDFNNSLLPHCGIEAYGSNNVKVTFEVDMYYSGTNAAGYITGDFTDNGFGTWQIIPMKRASETSTKYYFDTYLSRNQIGRYYFLSDSTWSARERINGYAQDRYFNINTTGSWMGVIKNFGQE